MTETKKFLSGSTLDSQETIDYLQALQFLKNKFQRQKKDDEQLYLKATKDFNTILTIITENYAPKRIYQWGSLLDKECFKNYSDIDIAVEGIDSVEKFFLMYKEIEVATSFPLDCVQFEKIEPEFRDYIVRKGRIVYERTESAFTRVGI